MTYSEKLKDPRWQRKRLEVMQRDDFACQDCGDKTKSLAVHHTYYVTDRHPWMYPTWSLSTLCSECHQSRHEAGKENAEINDSGEDWQETGWESAIGFLGVAKMGDFDEKLWDVAVQIAMHEDFMKAVGMSKSSWIMQAVQSQISIDRNGGVK